MENGETSSSDSEYEVESFVRAKRVKKPVNDDSADLLGNFDDEKRKEIFEGTYKDEEESKQNPSDIEDTVIDDSDGENKEEAFEQPQKIFPKIEDDGTEDDSMEEEDDDTNDDDDLPQEINTNLTKEQLNTLLRGASKVNRHVLYVTNLNFETTREDLEAYFGRIGSVKSVRIPKKRRGGFAFVEMVDLESFQKGFQLHNSELQGRKIKVQLSEAGKKKSANKKNIIKQKNRKLAEMRNEQKTFTKSGKFYDKTLKKEKAKEMVARKRWRKPPAGGGSKVS